MNVKGHLAVILLFLTLAMSPLIASADWTEIHQNQSSSHIVTMTGDGYYMDPSNAYDGIGSQSGDPVILRTQTCFSDLSPSAGTTIEIDYTLVTNQSSKPFHLIFNLAFIEDSEAPDGYASVAVYNENSMSFVEVVNSTSTGGADYNISRSSAYMDNGGNIIVKLKSGHSVQDCDASTETRVYEFDIYSDIQQQVITDTDGDGIEDGNDSCPTGMNDWTSTPISDYDGDGCKDSSEDTDDDNDGFSDSNDSFPLNALEWADFDEDTIGDNSDTDDDNDGVLDMDDVFPLNVLEWADFDEDTIGDNSDADDDNDAVDDVTDVFPYNSSEWSDNDNDSIGDNADTDDDNDGVEDLIDIFPFNTSEWADNDNDSIGDNADLDDDNDGYSDIDEEASGGDSTDNSVVPADFDGDFLTNFVDEDDDNDGILDDDDTCNRDTGRNWGERETDRSYSHNSDLDVDYDGCRDSDEDDDDDNDNRYDGEDQCARGDINWDSNDSLLDFDQDGCRDDSQEDLDDDNDLWGDTDELSCRTNPLNADSVPIDVDEDKICDLLDKSIDGSKTHESDNEDESECSPPFTKWMCNTSDKYESVSAFWIMMPVAAIGFVITLYALHKSNLNTKKNLEQQSRLEEGKQRFIEGDKKFQHIETEIDELEKQLEEL